ncbi:predicted GPI-anchored protein 58 [Vitis riparia]|uniref:predicted GPI-anchored protein 58 n=1 Tax=Vitis riparia TaxID=96939 RepID=UPI00155A3F8F|nr:predicted GPI-anchored protein 58 [Vitis riparia]
MARTRGAKSSSPSTRKRAPREVPVQASTSEPSRPEAASPPAKAAPQKRPAKPAIQQPPRDVISPEPSPVPSPAPPAKPQASQPPLSEPQIPSRTAPEAIIRRPMLTQPPIEGNLDCRARPFHSELCFDTATFQLRPKLAAYRMEQPELPQPAQIPAARRASPRHIPEGIPIASPTIARAPPVTPASSQPSTLAEPRMAIPISEYRDLCHALQALTAQHTAILRQLQHHLGLPSAAEHLTPTTAVPHSQATEPQAPPDPATEEAEPSA